MPSKSLNLVIGMVFRLLNVNFCPSDLPHTATSALTSDDEAVFCLALNNNSILLIRLQHLTGMANSHYLKQEVGSRGFLSGLSGLL